MPRLSLWAGLLGMGLGALFDGILLHRLLQWHHVLGAGARAQFADGVLDAAAMAALLAGLHGLWQRRAQLMTITGRCVIGLVLIGFALWHLAEGVLVHLVLRLHHVRPQADTPLLWDLLWLVVFGIVPLSIGLALRSAPER